MIEIETISTNQAIATLRDEVGCPDQLAYVKGYYNPGDGGGGMFIYKSSSSVPDDNGVHFKPYSVTGNGRWVRLYEGYINVAWFGALGWWGNYTTQINDAIVFAHGNIDNGTNELKVSTIFIPNGTYIVDSIKLLDGVSIIGENLMQTIIFPSYKTGDSINDYLVTMDKGRVRINISNLQFVGNYTNSGIPGNGNSPKSVFKFEGVPYTPFNDGGISYCTFKNISISSFDGNGIYLLGGEDHYATPNQFSIFENVRYFKGSQYINNQVNESFGLKIEGQNGQLTFINCQFDGGGAGTNEISKTPNVIMKGYSTGGAGFNQLYSPGVVTYLNCTFQNSVVGISLDKVNNVTIDNCWFERLHYGVIVNGTKDAAADSKDWPCKSINIINNLFGNVAGYGSIVPPEGYTKINGACIQTKKSYVNVLNNSVITSNDYVWNGKGNPPTDWYIDPTCTFVYAFPDNLGVNLSGNTFSNTYLGRTFGILKEIIQNSNIINCEQHRIINLKPNSSYGTVIGIDSRLNTTETLTIKAVENIVFAKLTYANDGSNISFPTSTNTTFTLKKGEVASFIKTDVGLGLGYTFELISVVRNNP